MLPAFTLLLLSACTGQSDVGVIGFVEGVGETAIPGGPYYCVDPDVLSALSGHLARLDAVARVAAAGITPTNAVALFEVPGVSGGSWFYLDHAECAGARTDAPLCAGGVCYTFACTGTGADWDVSVALQDAPPLTVEGWSVGEVQSTLHWDATARSLDLALSSTSLTDPAGREWMFNARSKLDGAVFWNGAFDALYPYGELTMYVHDGGGGASVLDVELAIWDGTALKNSDTCVAE